MDSIKDVLIKLPVLVALSTLLHVPLLVPIPYCPPYLTQELL